MTFTFISRNWNVYKPNDTKILVSSIHSWQTNLRALRFSFYGEMERMCINGRITVKIRDFTAFICEF